MRFLCGVHKKGWRTGGTVRMRAQRMILPSRRLKGLRSADLARHFKFVMFSQ
jgi:hypothetical protein